MKPPIELILPSAPAIDGLAFPECPRWHADAWWFSDMHGQAIYRIAQDGSLTTVLELDDRPAGLGFIGATMYAVAMTRRELLEVKNQQITRRVDLKGVAPYHCNDMVMDTKGRAYIGNFGFNFEAHEEPKTTGLALVREDGTVHQVADHLLFPNGMVLTDDGKSLIVAESYGRCLTEFDVAEDGSLSGQRDFARFDTRAPDGIGLDQDGAVWMASPPTKEVLRVERGGRVTHVIKTPVHALACMLGGPDGRTLMICSAPLARPEKTLAARAGRIDLIRVEVPHAGRP
jgi:sugar lactone lactonase YvrE